MLKKITITSGTKYLGDVMSKLPSNCLFDKGRVGCGGTSIALESDVPYVIAVPFIPLIDSKVSQYPNERFRGEVFGVKGGVTEKDVEKYLVKVKKEGWTPKFMVTYDSLKKLSEWINPKDYNLLVDELHILFTSYGFRKNAVQKVLNNYRKYKEFCFMTGTSLEDPFMLKELEDIRRIEAVWPKQVGWNGKQLGICIHSIECKPNVGSVMGEIVLDYLAQEGKNEKDKMNAYFFVNSVKFIRQLVIDLGLSDENTRVIYSKNNMMDVGIKRGSPSDPPKRINFITSTAFEGVDFMDKMADTYAVSDSSNPYTLLDISTTLIQIKGRIRDKHFFENMYHLYSLPNYKSDVSSDEYEKYMDEESEKAEKFAIAVNSLPDDVKNHVRYLYNDLYFDEKDNNLIFDANIINHLKHKNRVECSMYMPRYKLEEEYLKHGFAEVNHGIHIATRKFRMQDVEKTSFKDIIIEIKKYWCDVAEREALIRAAEERFKNVEVERAIELIGFEGIKKCGYGVTNVRVKLAKISDIGNEVKIFQIFTIKYQHYVKPKAFIYASKAKEIFGEIYKELDLLDITPKGTDIKKYFAVKEKNRKGRGYEILFPLPQFSKNNLE